MITFAKDLTSSPFSAHTGGCAGLVGVGVVMIFGYVVVPFGSGSLRESGENHGGLGIGERRIQIKTSKE